jgi:hypothetical protein
LKSNLFRLAGYFAVKQNKTISIVLSSAVMIVPIAATGGHVAVDACATITVFTGGVLTGIALR